MVNRAVLTKASTQYRNRKKINTLRSNKGNSSSVSTTLLQFGAVLLLSSYVLCLSMFSPSYTKYRCILSQAITTTVFPQGLSLYLVGYRYALLSLFSHPCAMNLGYSVA